MTAITTREITHHFVDGKPPGDKEPKVAIFAHDETKNAVGGVLTYSMHYGSDLHHQTRLVEFHNGNPAVLPTSGVTIEALIAIGVDRLECFQAGAFPCEENEKALVHLQEAMAALQSRTRKNLLK